MHASKHIRPAALLLLGAAAAVLSMPANPTDVWVTVNESGQPKTITPVVTVISGTTSVISGAPYDVTGTVFTQTSNAAVITSTGSAPLATATNSDGAGAFEVCHNKDGTAAPFCQPANNSTLTPGKTYYITWDPTYFKATNTTVKIVGMYRNSTDNTIMDQAFTSGSQAAGWGFYQWNLENSVLTTKSVNSINVTIFMYALSINSQASSTPLTGPTLLVSYPEQYRPPVNKLPTGPALYIGLPTIGGFIALVVIGTCIWNRRARKISLGNIMSRSRHGYGIGKSRTQRVLGGGTRARQNKEQAIRLMERDAAPHDQYSDQPNDGPHYRDWNKEAPAKEWTRAKAKPKSRGSGFDRPRRDSDALGSLAGTPTEERNIDFHRPAQGNAFRDELNRQDRERL